MASPTAQYAHLWSQIAEEYRALRPEIRALRAPEDNYMQLDAGGKAAHYEWKVINRSPSHVEVAIHFESDREEENQSALRTLQESQLDIQPFATFPPVEGRWSRKWTRFGRKVQFEGEPDVELAKKCAFLMKSLVEHTYPSIRDRLKQSAAQGWA